MAAPVRWALLGSLRRRWRPVAQSGTRGVEVPEGTPAGKGSTLHSRRGRGPPSSNMTFSTNEGTDRGPF